MIMSIGYKLKSTLKSNKMLASLAASVLNTGVILLIIDADFIYAPWPFSKVPIRNKITDIDKLYYHRIPSTLL